jgi:hypothetical protein
VAKKPAKQPEPSTFDKAMEACEHIAVGDGVNAACAKVGISHVTFFKELSKDGNTALVNNYVRAREYRADARFEKADDVIQELREGKIDAQSARVMLDNIKWQTAKEAPKRYGDKLDVTTGGNPIPVPVIQLAHGKPEHKAD